MSDDTPVPPEKVIRVLASFGRLASLLRNRDKVATGAVGKLGANDLTVVTGRGIARQWTLVAGLPIHHGTVADEAAMLALHVDSSETPAPRWVVPGDTCARTDLGTGYLCQCISGNGTTAADWAVVPTKAAIDALASTVAANLSTGVAGCQPLDSDLTAIAAQGTSAWGLSWLALYGATAAKNALSISRADISDASTAGRALLGIATPSAARLPQINADGSVSLIEVPTGGGTGGTAFSYEDLVKLAKPRAWWRAGVGCKKADGSDAASGETVATWQDQSGNGYHLTGAATLVAAQQNGLPILRTNGASDSLYCATLPSMDLANFTMLLALKYTSAISAEGAGLVVGATGTSGSWWNTTYRLGVFGGNAGQNFCVSCNNSEVYLSGSRPRAFGIYGIRVSGASCTLSDRDLVDVTATLASPAASLPGFVVGKDWPTTVYAKMDIGELIIVPKALGMTLTKMLIAALRAKWEA